MLGFQLGQFFQFCRAVLWRFIRFFLERPAVYFELNNFPGNHVYFRRQLVQLYS